jgi:hypothetical protein
MATVKKPVDAPVADLKVLTDFFNGWFGAEEQEIVNKWATPELATTVVTTVSNLMAVLVLVGWMSASDVETLTKAITALIGAGEVIAVNSLLIWKFIASRTALKQQVLAMKYQYVEAVAIEKMRAL